MRRALAGQVAHLAQRPPGRRDAGPVAAEDMRRADELKADALAELTREGWSHLRHERHAVAPMIDRDVDEHLRTEVLDGPDLRPQRTVGDDLHGFGTEADRDVGRAVRHRRCRLTVEDDPGP